MMSTMENDFSQESRIKATQGPAYSTGNRNLFFPNAPTIYVEGESDHLVLSRFIDECHVQNIQIPPHKAELRKRRGHRQWVADAVRQGNENRQTGGGPVIGIIDRDMGAGNLAGTENLYFYDHDDLEIMIINSNAFNSALRFIFPRNTCQTGANNLRSELLDATTVFGCVRVFFLKNQHVLRLGRCPAIRVEELDIRKSIVSYNPLQISSGKLLELIIDKNTDAFSGISLKSVEGCFQNFQSSNPSVTYRRGHDAVEILCCFIRFGPWQPLGNITEISRRTVHDYLLSSFQWHDFKPTRIRKNALIWANENKIPTFFRY